MLTIKKRFPYNKLYIAGSLAFIAGYGGIMVLASYLPQRYTYDQYVASQTPVKTVEPEASTTPAQSDTSEQTTSQAPAQTTQPATTEQTTQPEAETPAATEPTPTPTEPAPTTPEEPQPTEPTNPIEEIFETVIDVVTP